jgi:hypothetical protein
MTDDPHPPVHPPSDDPGGGDFQAPVGSHEQEAARWWTFASPAAPEAVEQAIGQALAVSPRKGKSAAVGARVKDGYVVRLRLGRKDVAVEMQLAGWEEGTRIHVALPRRLGAAQERECAERLQALLAPAVRVETAPR